MPVAVLEINDSELRLYRGGECLYRSSGFALGQGKTLLLGDEASAQARIAPRQLNHRFWSRLSLEPLAQPLAGRPRYADLVHAQLQQIFALGHASELVLAVPASYQREQLALLLGIAAECGFRICGLVDAAVAAACQHAVDGRMRHLDIQLHQCVVTDLHCDGGQLRAHGSSLHSDIGLLSLYDQWAQAIADAYVRSTRFDPLRQAHTEQQLYQQLPRWLQALNSQREIRIEIQAQPLMLTREQLLSTTASIYHKLAQTVQGDGADGLLLSHRVAALPGFCTALPAAAVLAPDALAQTLAAHAEKICADPAALTLISELPACRVVPRAEFAATTATHLLWRGRAYPVAAGAPLSLGSQPPAEAAGLALGGSGAALQARVQAVAQGLQIEPQPGARLLLNARPLTANAVLRAGDELRFEGVDAPLLAIQVVH